MQVTTGGVTVGVGALIVGSLSVAAVLTVRDENDGRDDCQPQSSELARAASEALLEEYFPVEGGASPTTRTVVLPADQAREILAGGGEAGTVSEPLPEWTDEGYVVIVDHDPRADGPTPPSCYDDTPVVYVEPGRVTG